MKVDLQDPYAGITECAIHTMQMDPDCQFCEQEFTAKNEVSANLTEMANDGFKTLRQQGIDSPEGTIYAMRLELLIESILQDRNRLHFEVEIGRRVNEMVQSLLREASRQKIHTPAKAGLTVLRG